MLNMAAASTLRNGRFAILEQIGEGAQGRTFAGIDKRAQQGRTASVAIKRFDVRGATSWKNVELAEREASVLQSLSHPNLPAYIDHFEEDGALYLVMERIEGESLGALRKRGAVLSEVDVVRLLRDASKVLDYLHSRAPPVIHRDLKPGNVIRRPDGSFAFVDFGAVRDKLRPKGGSTVVGTFGYMAPEQVQGRALPASDVYAIGATAMSMLTGCEPEDLPHRGLAIDVREALRERPADPWSDIARGGARRDGTKTRLAGVLEKMLEPDPERRASSIAPLVAHLDDAGGVDGRERTAGHDDRDTRRAERRAHRAARRAERATRRATRPLEPRSRALPWPARLLAALVFTFGIVFVSLATQLVIPLLLGVLSIFFARRTLTDAARAVRHAGVVAVDAMRMSRQWFLEEDAWQPIAEPRMRVDLDGEQARKDAREEADAESPEDEPIRRPNRP